MKQQFTMKHLSRRTATLLSAIAMLALCFPVQAQDENLLLHYSFEGATSTTVPDQSASGVTAQLKNQAKVVKMGRYHVLDLGNGSGYLDMTASAGALVRNLTDFTISVYYRVDADASLSGNGYFLWCFSQSAANTQTSAPYTAYRLNVQRMATSTGGYGNETGFEVGSASVKGQWVHMLYRQTGKRGQLYLNGKSVGSYATMPLLKDALTANPAYNWIGRPPFSGDSYLKSTLVYDFRLYGCAIADDELQTLAAETSSLEEEYAYGEPGDFAALQQALTQATDYLAGVNAANYPPNAIAELQDEVNLAQIEIAAGRISQTLIDKRLSQLNAALAALKAQQGFTPRTLTQASDHDHGFVHPGGLHTEADFDRIKQLLADGDPTITAAFKALRNGEYAQSNVATWPTETIWRSGSGDNYLNAARGAAMAYQNALVWKIAGTKANADGAVRILMQWARQNKYVSGNTNMSLAGGLYGYAFAQAAELVRDYEGWSDADKAEFRNYIVRTWYPVVNDFLRRRHATWANTDNPGAGGQRPGHYWSNWGLCNSLAMISFGIFLDDVHMYNQGLSFFKYDHVGTWSAAATKNRTEGITNWGLTEFLGNLVPVVHDDARGPYGQLGQMQESGRDPGHEQMAAGLAVDIAQVAYNQGDDLFAYLDHRLAAGLEFVAAHNYSGLNNLPWTDYGYADCRTAWHNAWWQTGYANEINARPYWDRVIGHYEGVKGVSMPYAHTAANVLRGSAGYDMGGHSYGETSGGYDHLGFSTLTCYRPTMADPATAPLELSGKIVYNGQTLSQTDLGGLKYNFEVQATRAIPADGAEIRLIPVLPEGVADNGSWQWNTGETTKEITVRADRSYIYRVCYTSDAGTPSYRNFSIAVSGDCTPDLLTPEITIDGVIYPDTVQTVLYGKDVILYTGSAMGWTGDYQWDNGVVKNSVVVIPNITTSRDYVCRYADIGGFVAEQRFRINVMSYIPRIVTGGTTKEGTSIVVTKGADVELQLELPSVIVASDVVWNTGQKGISLAVTNVQEACEYTATFQQGSETIACTFHVYVADESPRVVPSGSYRIRSISTDTYLTNADGATAVFAPKTTDDDAAQVWVLDRGTGSGVVYSMQSAADDLYLMRQGTLGRAGLRSFYFQGSPDVNYVAIYSGAGNVRDYWLTTADGNTLFQGCTELTDFDYELLPTDPELTAIGSTHSAVVRTDYFSPSGTRLSAPQRGVILVREHLSDGTARTRKLMVP